MRDYSPLRCMAASALTVHLKSSTVIELLDELDRLRAGRVAPVKLKRNEYPAEFEAVWEVYPVRPGDSKRAAHKAWAARLKAGATETEMLTGAQAYVAYVKAMKVEPVFIKQSATFFGPGEHYAADWTPPEMQKKPASGGTWWASDATILTKGVELGLRPYPGEQMANFKGRIQAVIDNGGTPPTAPVPASLPKSPQPPAPAEIKTGKPQGLNLRDLVRRDAPTPRFA